jgi:hypothetical protein
MLVLRTAWGIVAAGAWIGCAPTTAPTPPPEETLLVVNGGENSLSLIPIDTTTPTRKVPLGAWPGRSLDVAARGRTALVAGGRSDVLFVVDLVAGRLERTVRLEAGSLPVSVVIAGETIAYVAGAGKNTAIRVDFGTGDTASVPAGHYPVDAALTRGRLFVLNANLGPCDPAPLCPLGPSWITVVDPEANQRAQGRDSIPLPGDGDARSLDLGGGDGLLYVVATGSAEDERLGRLLIVDPLRREEIGSFSGFGFVPGTLASDGRERLFVTSVRDGLMEFNTRTRRVIRGAGSGVLLADNVAAAVDSEGRVYAVESGGCEPGSAGRLRVLRADLTQARSLALGECPTAATVVQIPAAATAAAR